MKKVLLAFISIVLIVNYAYPQDSRTVGLSASLQNNQYGISLPIWLGETYVLAPAFEMKFVETVSTDIGIGLVQRFYFKNEVLAPYFGIKAGTMINIPSSKNEVDSETKVDILLGIAFGAEYFIAEKFSLGVEAQGNFTKSHENSRRFGNPDGLNFNTATMVLATIYF